MVPHNIMVPRVMKPAREPDVRNYSQCSVILERRHVASLFGDLRSVRTFGKELSTFDLIRPFGGGRRIRGYFSIFPWETPPESAAGAGRYTPHRASVLCAAWMPVRRFSKNLPFWRVVGRFLESGPRLRQISMQILTQGVWRAVALSVTGAIVVAGAVLLIGKAIFSVPMAGASKIALHYAPNHNFDTHGSYSPAQSGFNLADVSSVAQVNSLKAGARGLVWVGRCSGVDEDFLGIVRPFVGNSNVFGFYLMDGPDPRGPSEGNLRRPQCRADNLKAESDWIHSHIRGARTFISLMTLSSANNPSFGNAYNPASTSVDLFGLDPYPCRTEFNDCDFDMIDRYVRAAESSDIPRDKIIPIYQAFGGGNWIDDNNGLYRLPTVTQECRMLDHWRHLLKAWVFDMTYSWGVQRGDSALENTPRLREFFSSHNRLGSRACQPVAFK